MPQKTWVVGEEVLAADFNTYVQEQVVATFPNAAARDAALPAPTAGMVCYLTDSRMFLVYTGAAWSFPAGSILEANFLTLDANPPSGGTFDLVSVPLGVATLPYRLEVNAIVYGGYGSSPINMSIDIWRSLDGAVVDQSPSPLQSIANAWICMSLNKSWPVQVGQDGGFKLRITVNAASWAQSRVSYMRIAT
jgi:hypothetical protein